MNDASKTAWRQRVSDFGPRARTAALLIALVLGLLVLDAFTCTGRWLAFSAALAAAALAAFEYARFGGGDRLPRAACIAVTVISPLFFFGTYLAAIQRCDAPPSIDVALIVAARSVVLAAGLVLLTAFVLGRESLEEVGKILREVPLATGLIGFGGAALAALTLAPGGAWIVLWLILVVSINDTAAYLGGSRIGGPKLCPAISPGKTIAGSLAGLIFGTFVGAVAGGLSTANTFGEALCVALGVAVAAQLGDLVKSYLKRLHGVKDSGTILPGHGGMLDRIDGILAGALVMYVWVGGAW